jgi:Uma2 family endonuclease
VQPARKLATYEDLLALPEDVRAEILGGEIVVMPAPLPRHNRIARAIGRFVGGPFDDDDGYEGPGGWWILPDVDVRLGAHDIVRPDVSGWRRARLASPWDVRPIDLAPDWVCEILSPSNAKLDRVDKAGLYASAGVPHYWIVDPAERILEAYALRDAAWLRLGAWSDGDVARIAPFDAIELDIGRLFPPETEAR